MTHETAPIEGFKWQGSYGAFSVSPHDTERVCDYIVRQKEHHAKDDLWPDWEKSQTKRAGGGSAG